MLWFKKQYKTKKAGDLKQGDRIAYPSGAVGKVTHVEIVKMIDAMSSSFMAILRLHMLSGPHKGKEMRESMATHDEVLILHQDGPAKKYTVIDLIKYGAYASAGGVVTGVLLFIVL